MEPTTIADLEAGPARTIHVTFTEEETVFQYRNVTLDINDQGDETVRYLSPDGWHQYTIFADERAKAAEESR